jgi:L-serine dehydratase
MQGTLGLVCDPLGGLVEIPCVFRNATGGALALAGIEMALAGIRFPIPADEVIDTMGEIGRTMDVRYRETAGGGLAATPYRPAFGQGKAGPNPQEIASAGYETT